MGSANVSVSAATYARIVEAAKSRRMRVSELVDLAVRPALGLDPRRPRGNNHHRPLAPITLDGAVYRKIRRYAERQGRMITSVADELINAALDREGAE